MTPADVLAALREELAREGLHLTRVVTQRALDAHAVPLRLADLLPAARAAVVVGDGGGEFFSRFRAAQGLAGSPHPLDAFTRDVIPAAVARALAARSFLVCFPFSSSPRLPVQKLGEAAGIPRPGPLGLQVHPQFGPWWAYRALVVLEEELAEEAPLLPPCEHCPAPCVPRCPAGATSRSGLVIEACARHRLQNQACHLSCVSRRSCIVGPEHGYSEDQLAFHMAHSLRVVRDYFGA